MQCNSRILLAVFAGLTLIGLTSCATQLPTPVASYTPLLATATVDDEPSVATETEVRQGAVATPGRTLNPTLTSTTTPAPTVSLTPTPTSTPTSTPTPAPAATLTTTSVPPPALDPTPVTLHTPDGIYLAAVLFAPRGDGPFPGVLLSHMGGSNKESWGNVPELLQAAGYVVLAYDFRGHGRSEGHLDPPSAATDLRTALAFLRSHDSVQTARIALVGASMGGMASVIVGASDPGIRTVVAISSSRDAAGQFPGRVIGQLHPRPFLAIGCNEDPITQPERAQELYELAGQPKRLVILECAAHANDILQTEVAPRLLDLLLAWLDFHVNTVPR